MPKTAPYGTWRSPITPGLITAKQVGLASPWLDGSNVYWAESRPLEGGRVTLLRRAGDGPAEEVTPAPFNVRTRVHEYGGGAFTARGGLVVASDSPTSGSTAWPGRAARRSRPRRRRAALRRRRARPARGRAALRARGPPRRRRAGERRWSRVAARRRAARGRASSSAGHDFYASPRLEPGRHAGWPGCLGPPEHAVGRQRALGRRARRRRRLSASRGASPAAPDESIFQPEWSPDGVAALRLRPQRLVEPLPLARRRGRAAGADARPSSARPQWVFGAPTYAFDAGRAHRLRLLAATASSRLARARHRAAARTTPLDRRTPTSAGSASPDGQVVLSRPARRPPADASSLLDLADRRASSVLRRASRRSIDPAYLAEPEPIAFPTERRRDRARASTTRRRNPDFVGPAGERPPLIVTQPRRARPARLAGAAACASSSGPAAASPWST